MTAQQLIEKLQTLPDKNLPVVFQRWDQAYCTVTDMVEEKQVCRKVNADRAYYDYPIQDEPTERVIVLE